MVRQMPPELVIFDCDGVLVDSERICVELDRRALAELGWELSFDEVVERFVGRSQADLVRAVEEQLGRRLDTGWSAAHEARVGDALDLSLVAVPGIVEALDQITAPACVASSGSHQKIRRSLSQVGLWERFAGRVVSASEVMYGKPAPDLFLLAAERTGVDPSRCVVVEDSRVGVEAARAAGMHALAYSGGVTPASRLEGPGTTVFADMAELPRLINGLGVVDEGAADPVRGHSSVARPSSIDPDRGFRVATDAVE